MEWLIHNPASPMISKCPFHLPEWRLKRKRSFSICTLFGSVDETQAHRWRECLARRGQYSLCVLQRELKRPSWMSWLLFCCFLGVTLVSSVAYIFGLHLKGKDDSTYVSGLGGLSGIVWDTKSSSVAEGTGCMCSRLPGTRPPCCYEYRISKLYSHRIIFPWSLLLGIIFVMIKIYFCHMVLFCQLTIHSCIFSPLRDPSRLWRSFRHLYPAFPEGILWVVIL